MSTEPLAWYRSLYWRIGLGLVVFLALILVGQGLLFIYLTDRLAGSMPARSPRQLAVLVASDLSAKLDSDPSTDLPAHMRERYGHVFQLIAVALRDGRTAVNRNDLVADELQGVLERQAAGMGGWRRFGRLDRSAGPARGPGARPAPRRRSMLGEAENAREGATPGSGRRLERGSRVPSAPGPDVLPPALAGARRRADFAPIVVGGERVGLVAVPLGRPPVSLVVRELGPTMGVVGLVVLLFGGGTMAFVVFGPARRRLLQLESATERLGAGDLSVRAPEHGGDEVATLARAFNQMAEDLGSRAAALEASDTARRQLLADVSHELMTPLTAMRGYIETLSMKELEANGATRERYLGIVDAETRRLEHIIGDLLDLARLEGNNQNMRAEPVSVAGLFERVAARHERETRGRRITLRCDLDQAAGAVLGDADRLEQALQNLTGNALRHTPDGGTITLSTTRRGDNTILSVRDTGPGIPDTHLPLIFDRFYKVDSSRQAAGGSGLGLSIVRTIIERHGGTASAHNDGGAVFEISLPSA
jgi:signal transduction histidine kinase